MNLGIAYRALGVSDQALARFDRALQLRPEDPLALQQRGLAGLPQGAAVGR